MKDTKRKYPFVLSFLGDLRVRGESTTNRIQPGLFLRLLLFLGHAVNAVACYGRPIAHIVGQAGGPAQISGFPAINQIRFTDKWTAHGNIVGHPFINQTFGDLKRTVASDQNEWHIDFLSENLCLLLKIGFLVL